MLSPITGLHRVLIAFEHDEHAEAADERARALSAENAREELKIK